MFVSCEVIDMCGVGERASVGKLSLVVYGIGCIV